MHASLLATQTGHSHLRRLFILRNWSIAAQLATLFLVYHFLSHDFAWTPMLITVAFLALANGITGWRLTRDHPVSEAELFVQMVLDVVVLSVLLYYAGGSTNPFISLYLIPLVLSAAILPRAYTWGMAALTVACYSLLMRWYVPLPAHGIQIHHGADGAHAPLSLLDDAFNTHVLGMWLGYVISAGVIAYFAVEMAAAVRQRDAQLNRVREETLRNERVVALGTLAASAAHELATPLSTMAVVIGEMRNESSSPAQKESLAVLDGQVKRCRSILDNLIRHAQETPEQEDVETFFHEVLGEWRLLRPDVRYRFTVGGQRPAPFINAEPALRAALLNLLNNAADASPEEVMIHLSWDDTSIVLEIHDRGPGLTSEVAARAGDAFFTTKGEGRGLGLFLANATLERLGGSVRLSNRAGGGATTEVLLPIVKEGT